MMIAEIGGNPPWRAAGWAGQEREAILVLRMSERTARRSARIIAGLGAILFGFLLVLTFMSHIHYERAARGFLEHEVERRLTSAAGGAPDAPAIRLGRWASSLAERNKAEADALRARIGRELKAAVVTTVTHLQDPACACRERLRQFREAATYSRIAILDGAAPHLQRVIAQRYAAIVDDLLTELRIFTGTNLLVFVILLALSFSRFATRLFLPSLLLAISTLAASAFYLLGQDWFFAILYGSYLGYAYGLWLLAVFALLCDVVLFRARLTHAILNALPVSLPC